MNDKDRMRIQARCMQVTTLLSFVSGAMAGGEGGSHNLGTRECDALLGDAIRQIAECRAILLLKGDGE
jgi:hypothetical protein